MIARRTIDFLYVFSPARLDGMSLLSLSVRDGVALVTLANPPMNAMDSGLLEELAVLFEGLASDRAVRAAVIASEGRAFSAGLDLKTVPGLDRLGQRRLVDAPTRASGRSMPGPSRWLPRSTAMPSRAG
jgi:enoyl-CoA hydratase/carnithine racemase